VLESDAKGSSREYIKQNYSEIIESIEEEKILPFLQLDDQGAEVG
jgi:hypothetical protein